MTAIPKSCDVLVIGGGPAGSSAATHLAQAGIDAVLLERALFPRNQVGESLIPHIWKFTDMTGVSEKIEQEGFLARPAALRVWNDKIHRILFSDFGYTRPGLHVERDIFDDILLKHAESCGAQVFNEVAVKNSISVTASGRKFFTLTSAGTVFMRALSVVSMLLMPAATVPYWQISLKSARPSAST